MKQKKKKWIVMVYLAGDNNLSEEMIYSIKEIYRAGISKDFDVIVQFDPSAIGAPVRRYVISQEKINEAIRKYKEIAAAISTQKAMAAGVMGGSSSSTYTGQGLDATHLLEVGNLDIDGLIEKLKDEIPNVNAPPDQRRAFRDGPENSADPKVLKQFICSSIREHPADHYMVILSGHGSGAIGDFLFDQNALTNNRPASLSIPNLGVALNAVSEELEKDGDIHLLNRDAKIDILGMDSCLMSMAEVSHELKDSVDFVVGSEGFVLNTGWPYHRILEALKGKSDMEPSELSGTIVQRYILYYEDYEAAGASTDQAICDVRKFVPVLEPAIRNLANALKAGLDEPALKDAIVMAHWEAQSYKAEQYTDLYDFCDRLQVRCLKQPIVIESLQNAARVLGALQNSKDDTEVSRTANDVLEFLGKPDLQRGENAKALQTVKELIENCGEVKKAIDHNVVLGSCYTGPAFQYSHGLSVYFPWSESSDLDAYTKNLAFAKDTGWGDFLKKYVHKTRREPLKQPDKHERKPHFISSRTNEIVETLSLVRNSPSGNPKGLGLFGSMKNFPTTWYPSKCIPKD
jgi:hypothetical protein